VLTPRPRRPADGWPVTLVRAGHAGRAIPAPGIPPVVVLDLGGCCAGCWWRGGLVVYPSRKPGSPFNLRCDSGLAMISRLAAFFTTAVVLCTLSCQSEKDSYVVLHTDVNCDVPRVYQLRVTVINPGTPEFQKIVPEAAAGELGFPSTLVLDLPSSRSGAIQVQVEAIDNKFTLIGSGTISGQIVAGGRIDLDVRLAALGSAPASSGSVDSGQPGDPDAGTTGPLESTAGGGVPFAQVAVGKESTCAIRSDGSLWCWGSNTYDQLLFAQHLQPLDPGRGGGRCVESGGLRTEPLLCGERPGHAVLLGQ